MALEREAGIIYVLLRRFILIRLPRLLSLKEQVEKGEMLNDFDIQFLEEAMNDATQIKPLVDKYHEYQQLYTMAVSLFSGIVARAADNEAKKS